MPTLDTQQISQYYELHGDHDSPPVLLIGGLGGVGAQWANQLERFSDRYYVILPDQRGTGRTTHAVDNGYTTQQPAADLAALVAHLAVGPVHVVGALSRRCQPSGSTWPRPPARSALAHDGGRLRPI